jgi:hypothetical protein
MNIKNKYCHNCGIKLVSTAKFCTDCGTSQASLSAKPPQPEESAPRPLQKNLQRPQNTFTPVSNIDDDDEDSYIDHIDHLEVSISSLDVDFGRSNSRKETVGQLMNEGSALPPNAENFTRANPAAVDEKAFLEQFRNEAGTLRNK